jgi:3'-5' exoribonuclease
MKNHDDAMLYLRTKNRFLVREPLRSLNLRVLNDPLFAECPGGTKFHHEYLHGLVVHVYEVMRNVIALTNYSPSGALVTAVIWHDYMKTREYDWSNEGTVVKKAYGKRIRHLAGSAMEFHRYAADLLDPEELETIEHLLLSHHGRKEWGSPVEPETSEAFILHAADMMSMKGCNL